MQSGQPYGDIFAISTPSTDRVIQQLAQEHRQREVYRQQQQKQLDDTFQKMSGNLRNEADVKEFNNKYMNFKKASQDLLRMNPNDKEAYLQKQMDKQNAYADAMAYATDSKNKKQEETELFKNMAAKPDDYDDNAYQLLSTRRQLPLSQLQNYQVAGADGKKSNIDLTDLNTYRYKGTNTDFGKLDKAAQGTEKPYYTAEVPVDNNGVQYKQDAFNFGATPEQYYNTLVGSYAQHGAQRDAAKMMKDMNPADIAAVQEKYNQLPIEKWKKIGVDKPQDLTIQASDPPAVQLAKHNAQLYFINNEPKQGKTVFRTDEAKKMALDQSNKIKLEGIRHSNALSLQNNGLVNQKELAKFRKGLGGDGSGGSNDDTWVDNYLDNMVAKPTGRTITYTTSEGKKSAEQELVMDANVRKALTIPINGQQVSPDQLTYNKETGEFRPIYRTKDKNWKDEKANGQNLVEPGNSQPISKEQLKLALGVKTMSKKQLNQAMNHGSKPSAKKGELD